MASPPAWNDGVLRIVFKEQSWKKVLEEKGNGWGAGRTIVTKIKKRRRARSSRLLGPLSEKSGHPDGRRLDRARNCALSVGLCAGSMKK